MKALIPLIILFASPSWAIQTVSPAAGKEFGDQGKIVINSLWESAGHEAVIPLPEPTPEPIPEPEPQPDIKPVPTVKPKPVEPVKKVVKVPTPTPTVVPEKTLTPGQKKIQEMLKKNKEALNKRNQKERSKAIEERDNLDRDEFDNSSMKGKYLNQLAKLKKKRDKNLTNWRSKVEETYMQWAKAKEQFIKDLPEYKENTISFESPAVKMSKKNLRRPLSKAVKSDYHVIPYSLDVSVRDQGRRPTCASFAGIRAIEVVLASLNKGMDLSEQYFYFSSKPECQYSPCNNKGSWVRKGFDRSRSSQEPDIPLESSCPYISTAISGNETQIPLKLPCQQGVAKVASFSSLQSVDGIYNALSINRPVIAGFKLTPNFYENEGLITYKDSLKRGKMDSHAGGHAVVLVGYMKLPHKLRDEGKICFITANSWGEGWGRGGHSCLTEKWVRSYRVPNAFVSVDKVQVR